MGIHRLRRSDREEKRTSLCPDRGSEVVAVMSRDKEKAQSYAKRHNIPRWYSDPQQLIGDEDVNAIYIATPPLFSCHFCHYVHEGRKARIHRETYGGQL